MNWWDIGNAFFEGVGSIMTWLNVRAVYRDKQVKGVQWQVTLFWTAWGVYNLFLYPHLEMWWSFIGGISIVTANAVWVAMVVYYLRTQAHWDLTGEHPVLRVPVSMGEQRAKVLSGILRRSSE